MFWQRILAGSLLAIGAQAGIGDLILEGMTRNSPSVERRLQEIAKANLAARGFLETRQSTVTLDLGSNTPLKPDGTVDMVAWNESANAACRSALRNLPLASNPSGTCVCYNLPALDNTAGTFEADLRLFQLNQPTGAFQGVPPDKIQVELSYPGASVSVVNPAAAAQNPTAPAAISARQDNGENNLRLLQTYLFVGQINKNQMPAQMTVAQLQALVMPIVTLKATGPNGQPVSTNVSSNEAAFVTGVFSQMRIMSNFTMAQVAVDAEVAALKNGTIAFVLPGVQLLIFPVGLIITSVWMVAGLVAYGMGTYARYNFREAHRRRMAVVQKGAVARI